MVGLFLQSFQESDENDNTGESIEVTLDPRDWLERFLNHNVFSIFASTGQCLDCIRSFDYVFNSFIACSRFLDPADKIAAGDSVDVTLAHAEKVSSLENQDSEPWIQVASLTPVPWYPFPLWNDSDCLSHLVSCGFLLCFCGSLTVMAFLLILCSCWEYG